MSPDAEIAVLDALAAELRRGGCGARLLTAPGKRSCLHIPAGPAGMPGEYAGDGWYWQGWAEPIAETADVPGAAQAVMDAVRAAGQR